MQSAVLGMDGARWASIIVSVSDSMPFMPVQKMISQRRNLLKGDPNENDH